MNNQDLLTRSGERLSFFQLFSEKRLQVEIPIIQRDYAQGRVNESAVRNAFLDALLAYLQQGEPHRDLDFVYGTIVQDAMAGKESGKTESLGRFIPLDGQQRLTTLFLLHWYLAQLAGRGEYLRSVLSRNGRSLFTYETRNSSKEFCDALMASDFVFDELIFDAEGVESVAATIQDKGWFYLSWASDPTILAMLTMLDAIHSKFSNCAEYFDQLVDTSFPIVTFLFLNLQEFNLTDDLYIKMNARGKPLTDFENFKAQLEKYIKTFKGQWPGYTLPFKDERVSGYEYFIHKIDTDWADLFWGYRNEVSADNTYDDELMNFIALIIANFQILRNDFDADRRLEDRQGLKRLFGTGGSVKKLSFIEYYELGCLSQGMLVHLIEVLDLLNCGKSKTGRLTTYLEENMYYSEEKTFRKVITNNTSYPEKLRFYAFYAGLSHGLRNEQLLSWMRVVFNLTENTIINTVDEYHRALMSLRDLAICKDSILEQLKQNIPVHGFTESQVIEEKVKAHFLTTSPEWEREIIEVEAHPFFRGQIGFILKFSGAIDYYLSHSNTRQCEADRHYLENFKRYSKAASAVFKCIETSSKKINYAWERAVLTKGEYFTRASASRYNLLSTRLNKNNIERDHSWRRLLRLPLKEGDEWDVKQNFVKEVFDDPAFSAEDVVRSLETICINAFNKSHGKDWRMLLVKNPDIFRVCNQGFIVNNGTEIVLLHESQRNHYHSELYSKFLDLELKAEAVNTSPFLECRYIPARSFDGYTYLILSNFSYAGNQNAMEIWYESDQYHFQFYWQGNAPCPQQLESCLSESGFKRDENQKEIGEVYSYSCDTVNQAQETLVKFCNLIRKLVND